MSDSASILEQVQHLSNDDIRSRIKMLDNNIKQYKLEGNKINHDLKRVE